VSTYRRALHRHQPGASVTLTANLFAERAIDADGAAPAHEQFRTDATNVPSASSISTLDFWPSAAILPQLGLATILAPNFTNDSPRPYAVRAITGSTRVIGALQSAP
jgi:hypothetical protein